MENSLNGHGQRRSSVTKIAASIWFIVRFTFKICVLDKVENMSLSYTTNCLSVTQTIRSFVTSWFSWSVLCFWTIGKELSPLLIMKSKKLNKPSRSEGIQPGKRITSDIRPWKYMVIGGIDTAIFPFISVQIESKWKGKN